MQRKRKTVWRSPLLAVHRHQPLSKQQPNLHSHQLQVSQPQDPLQWRRQLVKMTSPVSLPVLNQSMPRPSHWRLARKTTRLRSIPRLAQVSRSTQKLLHWPNNLLPINPQQVKALSPHQLLSKRIPTNLRSLQLHSQKIKERDNRWSQHPKLHHQEPRFKTKPVLRLLRRNKSCPAKFNFQTS